MSAQERMSARIGNMGWGQRIAAGALLLLGLIALFAVLAGGNSSEDRSTGTQTPFTAQSYTDAAGQGSGGSSQASGSSKASGSATASRRSGASTPKPSDGLEAVAVGDLPSQARRTVELIDAGGPFPYSRDGVVFNNAERVLPKHPRGWYHEYTVKTPGESDRGARRIVTGQDGTMYYTDDHYQSFRRVQR